TTTTTSTTSTTNAFTARPPCSSGSLPRIQRRDDLRHVLDEPTGHAQELDELHRRHLRSGDQHAVAEHLERVVGAVGEQPLHHPRVDQVVGELLVLTL